MKKSILKYYFFFIGILSITFFVYNYFFILNSNNFYSSTLEKTSILNVTFEEIIKFENSYFLDNKKQKIHYIKNRYEDLNTEMKKMNSSLKDRELLFLLNEMNETIIKHQETFFRSTVYLDDITKGGDDDLYFIELFNLKKSKELFEGQKISFDKKTERFKDSLNEYYKIEKNKKEKIFITIFLLIIFMATISLKYIFIWGENNGYDNSIKKNKKRKIKNLFY